MDPIKDSSITATVSSVNPELDKVKIPDLFLSFCARSPRVNPHFARVKAESESWIREASGYSVEEAEKHKRANFPFFSGIVVPDADAERFRCVCDWVNWIFDFDDTFDDGELNNDPLRAEQLVKAVMATMDDQIDIKQDLGKDQSLVDFFRGVWLRLAKDSSAGGRNRFKTSMTDYLWAALSQVERYTSIDDLDPVSYIDLRRRTIASYPTFALVEYCYGLNIPHEVMTHSSVKRIERLATEITILHNDVLSYHKEQKDGCEFNLIAIYCRQGLSQQASYDIVDSMIKSRYHEWFLALADVPLVGEGLDVQVQKYVEGCRNGVIANLNWSFASERYFGRDTETVRKTRLVPAIG